MNFHLSANYSKINLNSATQSTMLGINAQIVKSVMRKYRDYETDYSSQQTV
jgi:hypothetical protein